MLYLYFNTYRLIGKVERRKILKLINAISQSGVVNNFEAMSYLYRQTDNELLRAELEYLFQRQQEA